MVGKEREEQGFPFPRWHPSTIFPNSRALREIRRGGERGEGRGREGDGGDGALLVKPKLGND